MSEPIEVDDAIVLLLGAPGASSEGEIKGITRLEKLIFLLQKETGSAGWMTESAEFEPYNFGPFSQRVYQAVDTLAAAQLVDDSSSPAEDAVDSWETRERIGLDSGAAGKTDVVDPFTTRDFKLTERGQRYFDALKTELKAEDLAELAGFKKKFASLPLRQLVRYVYLRYPEYTTKSLIRDEILGNGQP